MHSCLSHLLTQPSRTECCSEIPFSPHPVTHFSTFLLQIWRLSRKKQELPIVGWGLEGVFSITSSLQEEDKATRRVLGGLGSAFLIDKYPRDTKNRAEKKELAINMVFETCNLDHGF